MVAVPEIVDATMVEEKCWCGSPKLVPAAHPSYLVCEACGTAKLKAGLGADEGPARDETAPLWGGGYWSEHQPALGLPPIGTRARNDLAERAQYWLGHLLRYRLPPGRVLEV